jgi:hypothetical protein
MGTLNTTNIEATIHFAALATKNEMSNKYSVDVSNLNKDQIKKLTEMGLGKRVRTKDGDEHGRGTFITCKSNFKPKVVDRYGNDVDGSKVGNGTKAVVQVQSYDTPGGYAGVFAGFGAIQIKELVEYNGAEGSTDGFTFDTEDDTGGADTVGGTKEEFDAMFEDE